ncbi:MAG: C39 family peptidase [Beduini sp.]|uniref:C39 family peptidase n=1 Tax=Beduini sp. TaxID=1922300 RepID=UPI0011C890D2
MKKRKIFMSCFVCLLLGGCANKEEQPLLKVKQDEFIVEYGEAIDLEAEHYLDLTKLDDKQKDEVLSNSTLSVGMTQQDMTTKEDQTYTKVGTYSALITYQEESLNFKIEVKDTAAPKIEGPDEVTLNAGETADFNDVFSAVDLSECLPLEFDLDQVDIKHAGDYIMNVTAKDIYENKQSKQVTVHVIKKEEETPPPQNNEPSSPTETPPPVETPTENKVVKLNVPYYNQMDVGAVMGCEATSLYMGLQYKGYTSVDLKSFISDLPRSADPLSGFSGDPFVLDESVDAYQGIFPTPLAAYGNQYGSCKNISGASVDAIIEEIKNGNPVVAYVSLDFAKPIVKEYSFGSAVDNGHVVLVVGYDLDQNVLFIQDPYRRDLKEVSVDTFKNAYSPLKYAVSIQ